MLPEHLIYPVWGFLSTVNIVFWIFMVWIEHRMRTITNFILCQGHNVNHIAIVLDGNRRGARKFNLKVPFLGHLLGFYSSLRLEKDAKSVGCREVTLYALSTHNLKSRSTEELQMLYYLLLFFVKRPQKADTRIRICGLIDRLPKEVEYNLRHIAEVTKDRGPFTLNICICYSSRDMIAHTVNKLKPFVLDKKLLPSDITAESLTKFLGVYEPETPVDMFLRTSGEVRFSDFMLWQSTHAVLCWETKTLPEVGYWTFVKDMIYYFSQKPSLNSLKKIQNENYEKSGRRLDENAQKRVAAVIEALKKEQEMEQAEFLKNYDGDAVSAYNVIQTYNFIRKEKNCEAAKRNPGLVMLAEKLKKIIGNGMHTEKTDANAVCFPVYAK